MLEAEGAPLVFATELAHDLKLHIETEKGPIDLPLNAESSKGGLAFDKPLPELPEGELTGVVRGKWGFDDWEGPRFHLLSAGPQKWAVAADDQSALIVGRDDTLHVKGYSTLCVARVDLRKPEGAEALALKWKAAKPDLLEVAVPLKNATPETLLLDIHQYGVDKPDTLDLDAYAEAASLEHLTLSAGDRDALLKGTRLDEVAKATVNQITWTPAGLSPRAGLRSTDPEHRGLDPGSRSIQDLHGQGSAARRAATEGAGHGEPAAAAGDSAQQGHPG